MFNQGAVAHASVLSRVYQIYNVSSCSGCLSYRSACLLPMDTESYVQHVRKHSRKAVQSLWLLCFPTQTLHVLQMANAEMFEMNPPKSAATW